MAGAPRRRWIPARIGPYTFQLLNLHHPEVQQAVMAEIGAGVDVYYDRRWGVTEAFCRYLADHPEWVAGKTVFVLGAGVGLETLVIGRQCRHLFLNELAPVALDLCARQLRRNRMHHFELLPGRYETLPCPPADLAVGCYIVYDEETARAMGRFLDRCPYPVMLMNEPFPAFQKLLKTADRPYQAIPAHETLPCVWFGMD